jgi:hypothetical protein
MTSYRTSWEHHDNHRLEKALAQDVMGTLRKLDITDNDLRVVTGADQRTVRSWSAGRRPGAQHRDSLEQLVVVVRYLLRLHAMDQADIAPWLRSCHALGADAGSDSLRPLDAIRDGGRLHDVLVAVQEWDRRQPNPVDSQSDDPLAPAKF